jgi:hypothetical protein
MSVDERGCMFYFVAVGFNIVPFFPAKVAKFDKESPTIGYIAPLRSEFPCS